MMHMLIILRLSRSSEKQVSTTAGIEEGYGR